MCATSLLPVAFSSRLYVIGRLLHAMWDFFSSTTIAAVGCETGARAGIGRWLPKSAAGKMMRLSGMFVQSSESNVLFCRAGAAAGSTAEGVALSPRSAGFANRMRDKHVHRNRNLGRLNALRDHTSSSLNAGPRGAPKPGGPRVYWPCIARRNGRRIPGLGFPTCLAYLPAMKKPREAIQPRWRMYILRKRGDDLFGRGLAIRRRCPSGLGSKKAHGFRKIEGLDFSREGREHHAAGVL